MPNDKRGAPKLRHSEVITRSALQPGADPIATRAVRGALTWGVPGFGGGFAKVGVIGDDDTAVDTAVDFDAQDAAIQDRVRATAWIQQFSAAAFYLDFTDAGAGSQATVEVWRVLDNGVMVNDGQFVAVGHRSLVRDELVQGLRTYYRITTVNADGATAVELKIAGEGLGFGLPTS